VLLPLVPLIAPFEGRIDRETNKADTNSRVASKMDLLKYYYKKKVRKISLWAKNY